MADIPQTMAEALSRVEREVMKRYEQVYGPRLWGWRLVACGAALLCLVSLASLQWLEPHTDAVREPGLSKVEPARRIHPSGMGPRSRVATPMAASALQSIGSPSPKQRVCEVFPFEIWTPDVLSRRWLIQLHPQMPWGSVQIRCGGPAEHCSVPGSMLVEMRGGVQSLRIRCLDAVKISSHQAQLMIRHRQSQVQIQASRGRLTLHRGELIQTLTAPVRPTTPSASVERSSAAVEVEPIDRVSSEARDPWEIPPGRELRQSLPREPRLYSEIQPQASFCPRQRFQRGLRIYVHKG